MNRQPKTEKEQMLFFGQFLEKYKNAAARTGSIRRYYSIAGTTVCLNFAGEAMLPFLTPALEHLRIPAAGKAEMTVHIWDTVSTSVHPPPPPCKHEDFTDRGDIWGFNSRRIKTAFHWSEYSVNVMDVDTAIAVYWVKDPGKLPYWVQSSPMRTIFHWWMEKNNGQLLHAAALGTDEDAVLITGKGGVGKSSTALACLIAGMKYLGDDYIIVKKDPEPVVFSLYNTAKLNMQDLSKYAALEKFAGQPLKKNQEKAVLFLYPGMKHQIVKQMPLRAILTPEIVHRKESRIRPVPFWNIQRAMSFTTMSQLPGVGSHTHAYISQLTASLPCFKIELGYQRENIPELIRDFAGNPKKFKQEKKPDDTQKNKPLISVIMTVYNGEKFIREAIENIMNQKYPALEIIIVDDGSTDNTKRIIEQMPVDIRYFHQGNSGPAAARNWGIKDASGEYLAFLDVDDLWPENNLQMLLEEMERDKSADVVRGYAQLIRTGEDGKTEFIGNPKESFPDYIGAALYRKKVFEKVGLYDPTMYFGEDTDWFNRAREINIRIKRLNAVTLFVRRHGENMTEGKSLMELNAYKVIIKALHRKRKKTK